eukprot:GFUD01001960.1.p1 GENE.GFUD01001960.1~~GFUD01001960.1.p1  ORF type:complete len:125 (+),score=9.11 GFUD01001960.1:179-553(+)
MLILQRQNTRMQRSSKKAEVELNSKLCCHLLGLYEGNVVPLQHNPPKLLLCLPLQVHLRGLVQHQVHVLIKPNYMTLNPCVDILIEPDTHASPILKVPKNEVDRLYHHLLDFLSCTVRHSQLVL